MNTIQNYGMMNNYALCFNAKIPKNIDRYATEVAQEQKGKFHEILPGINELPNRLNPKVQEKLQVARAVNQEFQAKIGGKVTPEAVENLINKATTPAEIQYLQTNLKHISGYNAFGVKKTTELASSIIEKKFNILKIADEKEGYIEETLEVLECAENMPKSLRKKVDALRNRFDYSDGSDFNAIIYKLDELMADFQKTF